MVTLAPSRPQTRVMAIFPLAAVCVWANPAESRIRTGENGFEATESRWGADKDHWPYRGPRYNADGTIRDYLGKRINCTAAGAIGSDGTCGTNVWPWPTAYDLVPVAAGEAYTQNYPANSDKCVSDDGCGPLVYGNYWNATGGPLAFKGVKPLDFAEAVRATYNAFYRDLVQGPIQDQTPIVTSGWRNPERNEAIGGVINSEHQWQATLDLFLPGDAQPIYDPANPDVAATDWCRLAKVAWDSPARSEVIVENSKRTFEQRFMFYWSADAAIDTAPDSHDPNAATRGTSCVDSVRRRVEECYTSTEVQNLNITDFAKRQLCSPNHIHAAR